MIKLTDFALRHFEKTFGGTKVLNMTAQEFETKLNSILPTEFMNNNFNSFLYHGSDGTACKLMNGYEPFCKLLAIENFTDAKVGSMPITNENYLYLRSGYSGRRESELPIFSRWFEFPAGKPKADWLVLVLYSKEQIDKESKTEYEKELEKCKKLTSQMSTPELIASGIKFPIIPEPFDSEWGIVAILGQSHSNEEPMKPETMIRNAGYNTEEYQKIAIQKMRAIWKDAEDNECESKETDYDEDIKEILSLQGKLVGGSGVPLNEEKYLESCTFWEHNATVK